MVQSPEDYRAQYVDPGFPSGVDPLAPDFDNRDTIVTSEAAPDGHPA